MSSVVFFPGMKHYWFSQIITLSLSLTKVQSQRLLSPISSLGGSFALSLFVAAIFDITLALKDQH